jgi:hypothetical protein
MSREESEGGDMNARVISMVQCATDTQTRDVEIEKVLEAIRTGGKKLKGQITQIRNRFEAELDISQGDLKKAKEAGAELKKQLWGVLWSGQFKQRANDALIQHSGLLCADLDDLGEQLPDVREKLKQSRHLFALFLSPTGNGLKAVFRVPSNETEHRASYRAIEKHARELSGVEIDQACKDVARLCFMSYDPGLYVNPDAIAIEPLPESEKPRFHPNGAINLSERQRIATEMLGEIEWIAETRGYVVCPGKHLHTTGDGERDCQIDLDNVPTVHCFHNSCRGIIDGVNHELRSRIAKAEYKPEIIAGHIGNSRRSIDVDAAKNPATPPAQYVPPPFALLPQELQDYVYAAAQSLTVDAAYILLSLLSALASAVGNTRSILLKRGFVQPPIIWTGIIGRSGSRKSPALDAGCLAVIARERELTRQNKQAIEIFQQELADWESKNRKDRGVKPVPPESLTCLMDNLTLEALADAQQANPRGLLVKKDELSQWLSSFDQYTGAKGADVSQWLSLHTGVFFGLDRRSDHRRYRIHQPRISITGGIQPEVLRRLLTEDFFERGLPARFLFAYPPFNQDKWSENEIPVHVHDAVAELFQQLGGLEPGEDEHCYPCPKLLRLDVEAKAEYVAYYNECGKASMEAGEREEAAWSKLSGYAARLALVGQLARNPNADTVTGDVMRAACDLARWFGNEAVRIYAIFGETREQREQRKLVEFIKSRGGQVTTRDLMQGFWLLKNQHDKAEAALEALALAEIGKWIPIGTTERGGRPTRKFQLLPASTSTKLADLRGKTGGCVDVDVLEGQKNTPSREAGVEAVSSDVGAMPEGVLEL